MFSNDNRIMNTYIHTMLYVICEEENVNAQLSMRVFPALGGREVCGTGAQNRAVKEFLSSQ